MRATALAALLLVLPLPAYASAVDESIVDTTAPVGAVSLVPGSSGPVTINLTVTGKQDGTATFDVYQNWTLSSGTFAGSSPREFTVNPRAANDPPTTFSLTGAITVDAGQAPSSTAFTLAVGAFDITNTNQTGAKLAAGKSSSYSVTVIAPPDTTAPTIAFTQTPNGSNGWFSGPTASVHVVATDTDDSGVNSLTCKVDGTAVTLVAPGSTSTTRFGDVVVSVDGDHLVSCDAADLAGNHLSSPATTHLKLDHTAPALVPVVTPASDHGWFNISTGAPTLTFNPCSDATSGLAGPCPAPKTFGEGAHQSYAASVADNAGNETMSSVGGVNVDLTKPIVTITLNPTGNDGWFTAAPAAVAVSASDANGIASLACTVDETPVTIVAGAFGIDEDGTHAIECSATDIPGNTGLASASLRLDATGPTITATMTPAEPSAGGWYNIETGAPTVSFECADATSGLAGACPTPYTFADGANQSHDGSVTDVAGHTATAGVSGVNVDTVAPGITATVSPAADPESGWYNIETGKPTVSFHCTDGTSGIASCTSDQIVGEGTYQFVNGSATDAAGNSTTISVVAVSLKNTAPSLTLTPDRDPDGSNGWYKGGAVTVSVTAADNYIEPHVICTLDGATKFFNEPTVSIATDGEHTLGCTAIDSAGNATTASVDVKLDTTPPSIDASLSPLAAASGWFNQETGAPTVTFTCSDETSGLAGPCPAAHPFGEGTDQSYAETIYDQAGNSASAGVSGVNVDVTAPTIAASVSPTALGAWFNIATGAPTVSYTCGDALSGIPSGTCPSSFTFPEGAGQWRTASVSDAAGNSSSATVSGINVDLTRPDVSITLAPDGNSGWYKGDPASVGAGASDANGIASLVCTVDGLPVAIVSDAFGVSGDGSHSIACLAADPAGNIGAANAELKLDATAPTILAALDPGAPAATGWYNIATGTPTVSFTCSDGTSGLAHPCPDPYTFADGANQSHTGTAEDVAGNTASATVSGISVDTIAPTIAATVSPAAPAATGWYNIATGRPSVTFACADGTSGVASCEAAHSFADGDNQSFEGTVLDVAGNSAAATVSGIKADLGKPTTSVLGPLDGATYTLGSVPTATCSSSDAVSGIKTAGTPSVTGGTVNGVGTFTATCSAPTDNAGNAGDPASVTYSVKYAFVGFFQPIVNPSSVNYGKSGRTYPVKWQIVDAGGHFVTSLSAVKSISYIKVQPGAFVAPDADDINLVATTATGGTALRYDAAANQFVYNWATPSGAASYILVLTLDDKSTYCAYFSFTR